MALTASPYRFSGTARFLSYLGGRFRKTSVYLLGLLSAYYGHRKKRIFNNTEKPNSFLPWVFSYTGSRPASNMAIVDVKMVSGFIPLKPTVKMVGLL